MITLRKFEKRKYFISKHYHFIAFFNTLNKIFESIIIFRLLCFVTKHIFIFENHFEKKKDIIIKYALHMLIEKIYFI